MFAALPAELQKELKAAYDQRQRQGENAAHQQPAAAAGKPGRGLVPQLKMRKETVVGCDHCSTFGHRRAAGHAESSFYWSGTSIRCGECCTVLAAFVSVAS